MTIASLLSLWPVLLCGCCSLTGYVLVWHDKSLARQGKRRIPEKRLMLSAALLGAPGVLAGMYQFRHKTQKPLFTMGVPALLLLNVAALYLLLVGL